MEKIFSIAKGDAAMHQLAAAPVRSVEVLISIPELARRLGTTVRHIRRLVAEKRIPYLKVGGLIRFDPTEIASWLEDRSVRPGESNGRLRS